MSFPNGHQMGNQPGEPAPDASCWWPKQHEEKWAAQSSGITRITGWTVLGIQALIIASVFFTDSLTVNLLSILAGFGILRGSQAWLRFNSFTATILACASLYFLAPALFGRPVELELVGRPRWFTTSDLKFWTIGVAFAGVLTMEAAVCILSLRTRKLSFWTRTSKRWGGIAIAIGILGLAASTIESLWESAEVRKLEKTYQTELTAIRAELAHHRPSGISSSNPGIPALKANPSIRLAMWESLSGGDIGSIFSRDRNLHYRSSDPAIRIPHRLPSGEFGHIVLYVDGDQSAEP